MQYLPNCKETPTANHKNDSTFVHNLLQISWGLVEV